jgi:hypothetical protein
MAKSRSGRLSEFVVAGLQTGSWVSPGFSGTGILACALGFSLVVFMNKIVGAPTMDT